MGEDGDLKKVTKRNMWGRVSLHLACEKNDVDRVVQLLSFCPEEQVLLKDMWGQIPLHAACVKGSDQVIPLLLEHLPERQVLAVDNLQKLPLHLACESGKVSPEMIASLLRFMRSDQLTATNNLQQSVLHVACKSASVEVIKLLLEEMPLYQVVQEDQNQRIPLHIACSSSVSEEVVDVLLQYEPTQQVLRRDMFARLPLHWACETKSLSRVQSLLAYLPEEQAFPTEDIWGLPLNVVTDTPGPADIGKLLLQYRAREQVERLSRELRVIIKRHVDWFHMFVELFVVGTLQEEDLAVLAGPNTE